MKIIIVDDNEENLYLLETMLKGSGYDVASATNGAEALKKLRSQRFDAIISDILMPVMDGFQLCRECNGDEQLKGLPFLFYTATYTDEKDEEFALALGADRFIRKPIEPDLFMETVREFLENYETVRLVAPREPVVEEAVVFRQYNEVLIRKLEDKMAQLEETNQALERDIVERKRAEEELRLEHDNLINILESMEDGIYIVNQQYDIEYVNPPVEKEFGPPEGRKCYTYFHHREEVCSWCKNQDVWAGKTVRWEWYSFKNERTYDLIDTPLKNPDGSISKLEIFRDITDRKRGEEKIVHLNSVLRAIRNVNQLITKEKDPKKLIKGACENLVETRDYQSAWIALMDDSKKLSISAEAGIGEDFRLVVEKLKIGDLPPCAQKAMKRSNVLVINNSNVECSDCSINKIYPENRKMSLRLKYSGKIYGFMSVSVPSELTIDDEEKFLFREVVEDIAFALNNLEREEERKQAEEELRKLKDELEIKVAEKTKELQEKVDELERFHDATVDRELRMKELRDKIEELEIELKEKKGK
ncbi:MAG: response regulator [Desulfobacteria bacterium]